MVLNIQFAHETDYDQIQSLLLESNLPLEDLRSAHLKHFLTAKEGPRIIGVVGLEIYGNYALLRSLAVLETFRGQQIGEKLIIEAEKLAKSKSVDKIFLLTTTAQDFFSNRGYQIIQRKTVPGIIQETNEFKKICPASAICMEKILIDV
jgi:amino-acid N-acetyltransferase